MSNFRIVRIAGAAVLLERDARPRICGVFGPPSGDLE